MHFHFIASRFGFSYSLYELFHDIIHNENIKYHLIFSPNEMNQNSYYLEEIKIVPIHDRINYVLHQSILFKKTQEGLFVPNIFEKMLYKSKPFESINGCNYLFMDDDLYNYLKGTLWTDEKVKKMTIKIILKIEKFEEKKKWYFLKKYIERHYPNNDFLKRKILESPSLSSNDSDTITSYEEDLENCIYHIDKVKEFLENYPQDKEVILKYFLD